ncbi:MAG TPA: aspartyl protease family protein [Chitinophagaceae bacterium]|nr:aspartyl protease family protein [Chitinophagaceae bacterium]
MLKKAVIAGCVFILLCASCPVVQAQEEFVDQPSQELTTVPFTQLTGGILILHARLGDLPDTLNFILDTGSSGISLDSSTAARLQLKPVPTERTIRGIASMHKVSFLYNQTLHFPGLSIQHLDFHINDYTIITAVYGEKIDGIIGYSVLSRYILKIDYDKHEVTFCSNGSLRYPRGGYILRPSFRKLVSQPLRVKDAKKVYSDFLFDLGAGLCMLFSKNFIHDTELLSGKRKKWNKQGEGLGGKLDMELTVIKEVKVGPYRFRKVPVYIFNDDYNVTSYPAMGGLLGNDIMRRFNVVLNYHNGEIFIKPNKHYNENFDYSYSGVELYLVNGIIVVGDIAKGSPAEAAGLREGDQVLGVNKDFSQNLNAYKIALQAAKENVKFYIQRNGDLIDIEFKILSII